MDKKPLEKCSIPDSKSDNYAETALRMACMDESPESSLVRVLAYQYQELKKLPMPNDAQQYTTLIALILLASHEKDNPKYNLDDHEKEILRAARNSLAHRNYQEYHELRCKYYENTNIEILEHVLSKLLFQMSQIK